MVIAVAIGIVVLFFALIGAAFGFSDGKAHSAGFLRLLPLFPGQSRSYRLENLSQKASRRAGKHSSRATTAPKTAWKIWKGSFSREYSGVE